MISAEELTSLVNLAVGLLLPKSIFVLADVIFTPLLLLLPSRLLGFSLLYVCTSAKLLRIITLPIEN